MGRHIGADIRFVAPTGLAHSRRLRNKVEVDGERSLPATLSAWLIKTFDRERGDPRAFLAALGTAILYVVVFSGLPPRLGFTLESLFGISIITLLMWRFRRRRWWRRAAMLCTFLSTAAFLRFGDIPFADRAPVAFVTVLGWGLVSVGMRYLHARVPTKPSSRQAEIALLLFALVLVGLAAVVYLLAAGKMAEREADLQLKATYVTPRSAYDIERCLSQTRFQRRTGNERYRFPFDRDHPDRRSYFMSIRNVRWTVIDRGDLRAVQMELPRAAKVTPALDEEAQYCATPRLTD